MIEYIFLIALTVIVILIIQQSSLRNAIISLGVFSLITSVLYLLYDAPDVALAEAVIGSTLATVLYLVALRKQEDFLLSADKNQAKPIYKRPRSVFYQRILAAILTLLMLGFVFWLYFGSQPVASQAQLKDYYVRYFRQDTGSANAVAAIYLQYRLYDTLFETLTLMISVMAVIQFSRYHDPKSRPDTLEWQISHGYRLEHEQQLAAPIVALMYPFILLLGLYIILFGHLTPGGGFQGGAVLSGVIIMRYIMLPVNDLKMPVLQNIEKAVFILIVLAAVLAGVFLWPGKCVIYQQTYLIAMNTLIGIKVAFGISIIFLRFVFYESR